MTKSTNINSKKGELVGDTIQYNHFFFSIQKLINNIGVDKYQEINKILLNSCSLNQIKQLNEEKEYLTQLVKKAIRKNPYNNEDIENLYGDSYTDFVEGILSKDKDFIKKVITFDEETHKKLSYKISNELFGYCIPYHNDFKESNNIPQKMQGVIDEANTFLKELNNCKELSESYKEKMKIGVDYLINCGNELINNKMDNNFNIESLKSNLFLLRKLEDFSIPIFKKLDMNHGIAHNYWLNLISDHQRIEYSKEFIKNFNFNELIKPFNSKYISSYKNNDIEFLENFGNDLDFNNLLNNIEIEQKELNKPKSKSKKLK